MSFFPRHDGILHVEKVPASSIVDSWGTPCYVYSASCLRHQYSIFVQAFSRLKTQVAYSIKANGNLAVIKTFASLGAGADIVSKGELARALAGGIPANKIVFSGVGKSMDELHTACEANIGQFNIESEDELESLNTVACKMGKKAPVALRINPDVAAATHDKISTGKAGNKFGIPWNEALGLAQKAHGMKGINFVGLAMHIGSQINDLTCFREAFERLGSLAKDVRASRVPVERLDLGGGLGVEYGEQGGDVHDTKKPGNHIKAYARLVEEIFAPLNCTMIFEPGRFLMANSGILLTRVLYTKRGGGKNFLIVDLGMNDFLRPSLYDAWHDVQPVVLKKEPTLTPYEIVGPVCESSDVIASARLLPTARAGDIMAVFSAGAYGAVQASMYNARPLAPEIMVFDDKMEQVRARIESQDLLGYERFPSWVVAHNQS